MQKIIKLYINIQINIEYENFKLDQKLQRYSYINGLINMGKAEEFLLDSQLI